MDTETFNLNVRNPFAIPGGKRYMYGTEFKTIECQEANFNNEISSTAQEVNFPLRGENVVWSFTRDTGFEVLLAIDKKVGNNDWTPVEATERPPRKGPIPRHCMSANSPPSTGASWADAGAGRPRAARSSTSIEERRQTEAARCGEVCVMGRFRERTNRRRTGGIQSALP